jgi:hypothetical protein
VPGDAFNASRLATVVVVRLTSNLRWAAAPGNVLLNAKRMGLPRDPSQTSQVVAVDRTLLTERVEQTSAVARDRASRVKCSIEPRRTATRWTATPMTTTVPTILISRNSSLAENARRAPIGSMQLTQCVLARNSRTLAGRSCNRGLVAPESGVLLWTPCHSGRQRRCPCAVSATKVASGDGVPSTISMTWGISLTARCSLDSHLLAGEAELRLPGAVRMDDLPIAHGDASRIERCACDYLASDRQAGHADAVWSQVGLEH